MPPLVYEMFEGPHDIEYQPFDIAYLKWFNLELILLDLHPFYVIGVVVPYEFGRLLNACELLDGYFGLEGVLQHMGELLVVQTLDVLRACIVVYSNV